MWMATTSGSATRFQLEEIEDVFAKVGCHKPRETFRYQREEHVSKGMKIELLSKAFQIIDYDYGGKQSLEKIVARGRRGDVGISLMCGTRDDLDLHMITPGGHHISYSRSTSSCGGCLDVDMNRNAKTASCDPIENVC